MKLKLTVLLLIASFGVALNLLPLSRREMHGNGQGIPNLRLTATQDTEVTKSTSQSLREPVSTGNVECDQSWLSSRSAELISPVGIRASVERRGKTLVGKTSDDNRCETTWILHLADQGPPQTLLVGTRDDEWYYEQIFEMNGWSKDGTRLLMSQIVAAGDWDENTFERFGTVAGKSSSPD
jgi:hypothetical protein